ncbi:CesD/SycD/LcrH family type III secretion system chaperone, partial [Salmonella enterica subsp. enterica serovar Kentucky]|nr:CesD/SycD/LcrH family type III secretion system chaperone [Salmonella enterica subsp. enterica serovar Kentucky]EAY8418878.1 CesD/SycD/LcrH family type III secretion system chaperone [Salmonella enterica]EBA4096932.1 CesD/SycD/LcrH family type III secretion system chaperone [Salmonella enterica]ECW7956001.1 CesD/SycD/LcrH family type III secretion system chaperone [Salmonella enterica subsp. enterica serovar Altona]EEK7721406.1 CesD/SycD/LcrH family type III secretion system chaperone [Salmo
MMMKEDQKNKIPEDILKQLLSVDPESVYASGYASWQEGDYSRAVIDFSWLVMAQPWSWRAHIALAGTWMMLKEYTTAINFYGHALMLDASHPEPVYQTGVCLKMMGEPGLAREAFQTA